MGLLQMSSSDLTSAGTLPPSQIREMRGVEAALGVCYLSDRPRLLLACLVSAVLGERSNTVASTLAVWLDLCRCSYRIAPYPLLYILYLLLAAL